MNYLIMLIIVIGLAVSDFLTGLIKAYVQDDLCSRKMRRGGMNKLGEIIVMATACGLEIGIRLLGEYYSSTELAGIVGAVTAFSVFGYIVIMELISILENYAAIHPEAAWAAGLIRRLRNFDREDKS